LAGQEPRIIGRNTYRHPKIALSAEKLTSSGKTTLRKRGLNAPLKLCLIPVGLVFPSDKLAALKFHTRLSFMVVKQCVVIIQKAYR